MIAIDELRSRLEERFAHSKFDLSDMCLIEPGVQDEVVRSAEERLGFGLPDAFTKLVKRFDFSKLSLANLILEYGHNLEKLVSANLGIPLAWWGTGARPSDILLVGATDGHAIFLSLSTGKILAAEKATGRDAGKTCIANGFEEFIVLAGSIALGRSKNERVKIASTLNESSFWTQMASGTA